MESGKYTPGAQTAGIVKWLRYLLIIQIIGLAATVLGTMVPLTLVSWVGRGVTLATAVVLFQLAAGNPRYKTAAMFQVVVLVCGIIAALSGSLLVSLLIGVLEFIDSDNSLIDKTKKKESVLYYPMESFAGIFFPVAKTVAEEFVNGDLDKLSVDL